MKRKFIFTQISAPIVGCLSAYTTIRCLMYFLANWYQGDKVSHVIFFAVTVLGSCMFGMFLWGQLLVKFGILSTKEAKGYPFAKPWELDEKGQYKI